MNFGVLLTLPLLGSVANEELVVFNLKGNYKLVALNN